MSDPDISSNCQFKFNTLRLDNLKSILCPSQGRFKAGQACDESLQNLSLQSEHHEGPLEPSRLAKPVPRGVSSDSRPQHLPRTTNERESAHSSTPRSITPPPRRLGSLHLLCRSLHPGASGRNPNERTRQSLHHALAATLTNLQDP